MGLDLPNGGEMQGAVEAPDRLWNLLISEETIEHGRANPTVHRGDEVSIEEDRVHEVHGVEDSERPLVLQKGGEVQKPGRGTAPHEDHIGFVLRERQEIERVFADSASQWNGKFGITNDANRKLPESGRLAKAQDEILVRIFLRSDDPFHRQDTIAQFPGFRLRTSEIGDERTF
jgi:hypothetical protein